MILLNLLASYQSFTEPTSDKLLPDLDPQFQIFTLVLDLKETLVYSDWKVVFLSAYFRLCCVS